MNVEIDNDLSYEDRMMQQECCRKIVKHIDRNLDRIKANQNQYGRLLSMRWFILNEI